MPPEVSLRLLEPTGSSRASLHGKRGMRVHGCVAVRVAHLHLAAICLLVAALPSLVKGGLDMLVWFQFASVDSYQPTWLASVARLSGYALFLSACSITVATYRLVHRPV